MIEFVVGADCGERLDIFLTDKLGVTRSKIKSMIERQLITVNDTAVKAGKTLKTGDVVEVDDDDYVSSDILPENIPLDIVYDDNDLAVINKPQGMVVHPSAGCYSGTLVNALMFLFGKLSAASGETRTGIVHRLDKDTTGLMVVAKNDAAHVDLSNQIGQKTATRIYNALLEGVLKSDSGTITTQLGRDPKDRKKMAVVYSGGKTAVTEYKVLKRFERFTLAEFKLQTGRTHQIRVHSKSIGHPVVGDKAYGYKNQSFKLDGQLLHSCFLEFTHPTTKQRMSFSAPLPKVFCDVLSKLN